MDKPVKTLIKNIKQFFIQVFAHMLVLILAAELCVFTLPAMAAEGIEVDTSAEQAKRPTVDTAQNGVALINLAGTDSHGVSHNKFTNYNVSPGGLILNNSTSAGVSRLGGAVYANPNYQNGNAASLVINEVTGNKRSNLFGYTEMFGKSADFILANPNGIVCNGAGFINMPRVTLSTGAPVFNAGIFRGLDIRGGGVLIEGTGLDSQSADYFSIVTRMASLNGPLWGRDVSIITGTGYYNYNDKVFTQEEIPGGKPVFAIDASALGSIYAGRISLVCNEKGVGVRSQSNMLADASDIKINADGNIELKDMQAAKDIDVASISGEIIQAGDAVAIENLDYSAGRTTNRGSITALKENLSITGRLDNETGSIASGGNIRIDTDGVLNNRNGEITLANSNTGNIQITGINAIDGNGGEIKSSGGIILSMTGDITLSGNTGNLYAERAFTLNAANVVNDKDLQMEGSILINATGSISTTAASKMISNNAVILDSSGSLTNSGEISGEGIIINSSGIVNNGDITGRSRNLIINTTGSISNSSRISSESNLEINAANVTNTQPISEISSGQNLLITSGSIINNGGLLFSAGDMYLDTASLDNISTNAYIYSIGNLTIHGSAAAGNRVYNYSGHIESVGDMTIDLVADGMLENTGEDTGTYGSALVNYNNYGYEYSEQRSYVVPWIGVLDYYLLIKEGYGEGYYALMQETFLNSGDMQTVSGYILSQKNMSIIAGDVKNHGSVISSGNNMTITANRLINETYTIDAPHNQHWGARILIDVSEFPAYFNIYQYEYSDYWTSDLFPVASDKTRALIQAGGNIIIDNQDGTVNNSGTIQARGAVDLQNSGSANNGINGSYNLSMGSGSSQNGNTNSNQATSQSTGIIDVSQYVTIDGNGNAMFRLDKDPNTTYLIETRIKYIDLASLYGSQYFFDRIGYNPNNTKILGDAFYEQQIVMQAIFQATAERYLSEDIKSDQEEMKALLDNAATAYKDLKLAVGIELTKEQINKLQEPIIWYVEEKIKGITVLAPKIFIPEHILTGFANKGTVKIAGGTINMNITGGLVNSGLIRGKTAMSIKAGSITNASSSINGRQAEISGGNVCLDSTGDIINTGGVINAGKALSISTAGDIVNETLVKTTQYASGEIKSSLGSTATIESGGKLRINAGGDFTNKGADVKSGSDAEINATGIIDFETVELRSVKRESRYGVNGVSDSTKAAGSNLNAGGNLKMSSGADINFIGSNADISGKADVRTDGNFNLINDYNTDSFKGSKSEKKSFGRKKTTTVETYDSTIVASVFKTGGDLNAESGNDINIVGSSLTAGKDSSIKAAGTQNIIAANEEHYFSKETKKSGFGVGKSIYGSQKKSDMTYDSLVNGSNMDIKGKFASHSGKDTNIVGSNLTVGDTAEITTGGSLNIAAAYNRHNEEHRVEKSGIGGGKDIYSKELDLKQSGYTQAKGSVITSGNLKVKTGADVNIIGSTINARSADFDTAGSFTETSAQNTSYDYHIHEKISISSGSGLKKLAMSALTAGYTSRDMLKYNQGRVSVELGRADYHKLDAKTNNITQTSSDLNTANGLTINSGKDLTIAGSSINAGGDVSLAARGNVNIITTEEITRNISDETTGSAAVTAGVKNAATDVYYAGKDLAEAKKALKKGKDDYDMYKDNLAKAKEDLNKELIDQDDYNDLVSEEKYYKLNLALLTENVAAKTANLITAAAGAASSAKTYGFNADLQLDIDAKISKSKNDKISQVSSNLLTGGNLTIKSGETAKIQGSNASAQGDMTIDAGNVEILAAENTETSSSSTKHGHINVSVSTSGTAGVNASADFTEGRSESVRNVNSRLDAKNITIKSAKDTTVSGGVVTASNNLNMNVGGNLLVESLQDRDKSGSHTYGASAGFSSSKDGKGLNAGVNYNVSKGNRKWVEEQTSLTGANVNIYVEEKTILKGAVIASTTNNLTLDTGSFEYSNIKDKDISNNVGAGINIGQNYAGEGSEKNNSYSANASYGYTEKRQTNFATISEGTIIVRDGKSDLSKLNRDVKISRYSTVDVGLQGGFTVDSSTVNLLTTNPKNTVKNTIDAFEKGYEDAKETTLVIYEKSGNLIVYGEFGLDGDYNVTDARIHKQILEKYGQDVSIEEIDSHKGFALRLEDGRLIQIKLENGIYNANVEDEIWFLGKNSTGRKGRMGEDIKIFTGDTSNNGIKELDRNSFIDINMLLSINLTNTQNSLYQAWEFVENKEKILIKYSNDCLIRDSDSVSLSIQAWKESGKSTQDGPYLEKADQLNIYTSPQDERGYNASYNSFLVLSGNSYLPSYIEDHNYQMAITNIGTGLIVTSALTSALGEVTVPKIAGVIDKTMNMANLGANITKVYNYIGGSQRVASAVHDMTFGGTISLTNYVINTNNPNLRDGIAVTLIGTGTGLAQNIWGAYSNKAGATLLNIPLGEQTNTLGSVIKYGGTGVIGGLGSAGSQYCLGEEYKSIDMTKVTFSAGASIYTRLLGNSIGFGEKNNYWNVTGAAKTATIMPIITGNYTINQYKQFNKEKNKTGNEK